MKDLDLTTLRLFVDVTDTKSIKRVANRENIDASAITKRFIKLEEQLQTTLLRRIRQGVEVTPEGALFSEQARRLVNDARRLTESMSRRNNALSGVVTVASHMGSMSSVLTDDLAMFLKLHQHESVQLIVKEAISKDAVQMVRDGRADLAVVWDNTETSDLQHMDYYKDRVVAVMHRDHPLANRNEVTYQELVVYDFIADKHTKHTEALLQRSGGITCGNARIVVQVDSSQSALRLAAKDIGIYLCQERIARMQVSNLGFFILPITDNWTRLRVKMVYKSNLFSPAAKALVDHLAHQHQSRAR